MNREIELAMLRNWQDQCERRNGIFAVPSPDFVRAKKLELAGRSRAAKKQADGRDAFSALLSGDLYGSRARHALHVAWQDHFRAYGK